MSLCVLCDMATDNWNRVVISNRPITIICIGCDAAQKALKKKGDKESKKLLKRAKDKIKAYKIKRKEETIAGKASYIQRVINRAKDRW